MHILYIRQNKYVSAHQMIYIFANPVCFSSVEIHYPELVTVVAVPILIGYGSHQVIHNRTGLAPKGRTRPQGGLGIAFLKRSLRHDSQAHNKMYSSSPAASPAGNSHF